MVFDSFFGKLTGVNTVLELNVYVTLVIASLVLLAGRKLVNALMSLRLWELASPALPMLVLLT